jgi:hypothetical protein
MSWWHLRELDFPEPGIGGRQHPFRFVGCLPVRTDLNEFTQA